MKLSLMQKLRYLQEWGVYLPNESAPIAATTRYTDFILATASGTVGDVRAPGKMVTPFEKTKLAAYTLGAMAPCMRLYAVLGKELKQLAGPDVSPPHPFQKWIDCYASEDFMVCIRSIKAAKLSVAYKVSLI